MILFIKWLIPPFQILVTGGAGVGKSHLIKTVFLSVSKLLLYKGGEPEKSRILFLVP